MYFKKRKVTQNKLIFREVWVSLQNDQCLFSKYWDDFFGLFVFSFGPISTLFILHQNKGKTFEVWNLWSEVFTASIYSLLSCL